MSSFLGRSDLSRGLRNNNPGNLVITSSAWIGKIPVQKNTDGHFEQFTEVKYGIRAMLRDIINDFDKGLNTVRKLINEYAPKFENDTNHYVNVISEKIGVDPDSVIKQVDYLFMLSIARAIIDFENGKDSKFILDSDINDAIEIIGDFNLKSVVVTQKKTFKFNYLIIPVLLFFYTVLTVIVTV